MPTVPPYHVQTGPSYHVRDDCPSTLMMGNVVNGTGTNRRICRDCLELLLREYYSSQSPAA